MAQDDPVVSAQWMHEHLVMPDVKVLDASWYMPVENRESWKEYQVFSISYLIFLFEIIVGAKVFWYPQVAHIPGALFFDLDGIVDRTTDARQIVGSAVLVKARDRPEIEDDEFYSLDLYCQGKLVGTVGQGFNFGGGDLLQVIMGSSEGTTVDPDSENQDSISSREHVWTPFAEDIVPDVDMGSREMRITPPKGLLELNSRSDKRSKKERHAMVRSASSFSSIHARIYSHDLHLKRNKECVRSIVLKC
ncbi:Thiosulfate/3-mercaptopyruvate sulfurtransferase 2 [Zea mays]|uniref:Thiosulfate/3-mercaptopyruvate sulfurtransferase 2 n=1 Tax=Zea mays TaxID=4577 RepID=A0A3L6DXX7_MAIZE|nr:Thiosulfate/3-mercaptopyruvate sulfurtransferase 2 [Zea mays]